MFTCQLIQYIYSGLNSLLDSLHGKYFLKSNCHLKGDLGCFVLL